MSSPILTIEVPVVYGKAGQPDYEAELNILGIEPETNTAIMVLTIDSINSFTAHYDPDNTTVWTSSGSFRVAMPFPEFYALYRDAKDRYNSSL